MEVPTHLGMSLATQERLTGIPWTYGLPTQSAVRFAVRFSASARIIF